MKKTVQPVGPKKVDLPEATAQRIAGLLGMASTLQRQAEEIMKTVLEARGEDTALPWALSPDGKQLWSRK